MTIKAILFDHDGTLVDSERAHYEMWREVLAPYGVTLTAQQYKDLHAGIPTPTNAVDLVQRYQLAASAQQLIDAKEAATDQFLSQQAFPLTAGAAEAVQFVKAQGLTMAVVTGAGQSGVDSTVYHYGLDGFFTAVVSGDDVEQSKPAPDCYLLALERLGLTADECIAIEDTQHGTAAATAAGIACIAVPTPMSEQHDFSAAIACLDGLSEVAAWVADRYQLGQ